MYSCVGTLGTLGVDRVRLLLDYIVPDYVHVLSNGRIVKSGDKSLALELEAKGYGWIDGIDDDAAGANNGAAGANNGAAGAGAPS